VKLLGTIFSDVYFLAAFEQRGHCARDSGEGTCRPVQQWDSWMCVNV